MADQKSATCCGHDASMQQISCSHWLPLRGLGSVGLLAFSNLFDFPRDHLELAILHDLPHFSGRSTFSGLRTCAGCSHRTTGVCHAAARAHRAASAYRAAGAPRRADGADDLLRRQGRAGCVRPRLRQLDRGRGTGRFSRGAALPEFLPESQRPQPADLFLLARRAIWTRRWRWAPCCVKSPSPPGSRARW